MGKAARRERRDAQLASRPQWAGAFGFQRAWKVNERYLDLARELTDASSPTEIVQAERGLMHLRLQMLDGDLAVLEQTADASGTPDEQAEAHQMAGELASMTQQIGGNKSAADPAFSVVQQLDPARFMDDLREEEHPRAARALVALAESHKRALRATTPIRFDPLDLPAVDSSTLITARLPFPTVTCDFLTPWGMSLPVVDSDGNGRWVGLVAATLQETASGIDVWPIVTTLRASEEDDRQSASALLFGRVRFGAPLPAAPEGFVLLSMGGGVSAWLLDMGAQPSPPTETGGVIATAADAIGGTAAEARALLQRSAKYRAELWLDLPARAACAALQLLDAVNVSLQPARLDRREQRRVARFGAEPAREVVIRASQRYGASAARSGSVDYQHRWTVRGHPKFYTKGAIFDANPHKRVSVDGVECVKVWCPAFIKGPQDKPLILKSRRVPAPVEETQASEDRA